MACGAGSLVFVRAATRVFNCDLSASGESFLISAPEVPCSDTDPAYASMYRWSVTGLAVYLCCYVLLCIGLWSANNNEAAGMGLFYFLGDKYEDEWYFWEMVVIARKVLLMVAFELFSGIHAWMLGTIVLVMSLMVHVFAHPYEDDWTDWTDLFSLAAKLIILLSGPVYLVLSNPEEMAGQTDAQGRSRSAVQAPNAAAARRALEISSIVCVWLTCAISLAVQIRVYRELKKEGDYKVRMLKEHEREAEERKQELAKKIVDLEHALEEQQRVEDLMNKDSEDEEEQVVSNPMFESGDGSPASGKGGSDGSPASGKGGSDEEGGDEEAGKGASAPGTPQGKWAAKAKQAGLE